MSKINLNNYEAFMLDYFEGNLSPQDTLALKAFAVLHPELDLNFDEELVSLENESFVFEGKKHIKASFNDEFIIGYLENVLEGEEKKEAEKLAQNNTVFKHELELYKKTIAIADENIVFENKEKLKRRGAIIFFSQNNFMKVAAALLLLFGIWFMISRILNNNTAITPEIANKVNQKEKATPTQVTPQNTLAPVIKESENNLIAKQMPKNYKKSNNLTQNNIVRQENTTSTISVNTPQEKQEPQLADRILIKNIPENRTEAVNEQIAKLKFTEETTPKYIIEEGFEEDEVAQAKPKSKFWQFTSGLLKGLNRKGIENVNSSENNDEMYIGALTISKAN